MDGSTNMARVTYCPIQSQFGRNEIRTEMKPTQIVSKKGHLPQEKGPPFGPR